MAPTYDGIKENTPSRSWKNSSLAAQLAGSCQYNAHSYSVKSTPCETTTKPCQVFLHVA